MASNVTRKQSSSTGPQVVVRTGRGSKVKFGSVTISGIKPSAAAVKANIARSTEALERVTKRLTKPGVTIRAKKNVPQYSIADGETEIYVRKLNGHTERGRFIDGSFRVIG